MFRRLAALAGAVTLAAGLGVAALAAGPANATTGTCLGTQNPVSGPVSCGGLFLPGMDPSPAGQPNTGTLSLTASGDYWNAPLTFSLYSPSASSQDFTVYERCTSVGGTRTEANPCGSGTPVLNAASGRPEFVAELTPLGAHIGGALNSLANLCISYEGQLVGPNHKTRAVMVARTCDSGGAVFTAGIADGTNTAPGNTGVPGVVVDPNLFQTFAAIPGASCGSPAATCDVIANDVLSHNFHNVLFVVDDQAFNIPGRAILYPENDGRNELAQFDGCNGAVISTGLTYTCA